VILLNRVPYQLPEPLTCDPAKVANGVKLELVKTYIRKHETRMRRYVYLENLYKGFHDVYKQPEKEAWKPDNRLAVNFPRYITETFSGYGYGIPIKETHPDEVIEEAMQAFGRDNELTDHEGEMVKLCCIYGHAFEYLYQNEERKTKLTAVAPKDLFVVYDDTMQQRALFAVRYGYHRLDSGHPREQYGEILTREAVIPFEGGQTKEAVLNPYGYIPVVEWRLNDERMGIYENVAGLVEAYNHAIGEKANDVDAFADAYLAVLGSEVDEDGYRKIRDNRLINLYGTDSAKDIIVEFLQKPTADGTQENLLNRLENLIYQTSMVANISDETFGSTASGIALAYKLQAMSNLALTFDRKIEKSLRKRYKIFCSLSTNVPDPDAWRDMTFDMTRNLPKNRLEEAQTAQALEGIVSHETQLKVLSIVDSPKEELNRIEEEDEKQQESIVDKRMFEVTDGQPNLLAAAGGNEPPQEHES
jgi:SPP1 family phage portal protein